jgi:TetR/AcrR family transcriptional regulator, fatty acid metabolism regulator protein
MRTKSGSDGRAEPTFIEAARRAQLIDAAIDTLVELGYARTTMAEIARRANISKSVISYYFESKEALLEQVVESVYRAGAETVAARVLPVSSALEALRLWIRTDVEFIAGHPREVRAVAEIAFGMRAPDGSPHWDASSCDWMVESVEELFRAGQRSGEFRAFSTRAMAVTLRAAIDRVSFELMTRPGLDMEEYANELITLFELATGNPDHEPSGR